MKVFLIAGESSGDKLGAALMVGLRDLVADVEFVGVGGPLMEAEGMQSLFPMSELSVMGIAEILPKYRALKRRIAQTAGVVLDENPDVLITIDSPDFCLRVAKIVKKSSDLRAVHYVAPSVWAWREGRAAKMAKVIDHVLALLPFEPPYMEAVGMRCDFVGHPVVAEDHATNEAGDAWRNVTGIGDAPIILALPGSRRGEVMRLAQTFSDALKTVVAAHPTARVVVPTVPHLEHMVRGLTADWAGDPVVICNDMDAKRAAFAAADIAVAASGTVSLELAANETPMVIAYDMNWFSRQIIKRMLKIDTVTLVNLVSETRAVPELLGEDCEADKIANMVLTVMNNPNDQIAAMNDTMDKLGRGGDAPGLRAARAILEGLKADNR